MTNQNDDDGRPPFNAGLPKPSKYQLQYGIYLWVRDRVEGHVGFAYLDKLTYEDMMLLARAMGYNGPGSEPVPAPVVRIATPRGDVLVDTSAPDPDAAMKAEMVDERD